MARDLRYLWIFADETFNDLVAQLASDEAADDSPSAAGDASDADDQDDHDAPPYTDDFAPLHAIAP